jgi:hypothetical protein
MKGVSGYRPPNVTKLSVRSAVQREPNLHKRRLFKKESDLRSWVKERTQDPFWIEPTRGSTIGVPDVYAHDSGGVWVELKHGDCKDRRLLQWKPRPGQYDKIRTLRNRGARVGVAIGFGNLIFVTSDPELFRVGWAEIRAEDLIDGRDPDAWSRVIETILNDCQKT